jgi:PAS domain-containing protein
MAVEFVSNVYLVDHHKVIQCNIRDITRRKEAEQAQRQSEIRYRSYIEMTEQLGWTTDADREVVEDILSWRKFTGQSEEEVKGWGRLKALHPDDLE